jgi:hypothetical protein
LKKSRKGGLPPEYQNLKKTRTFSQLKKEKYFYPLDTISILRQISVVINIVHRPIQAETLSY